MGIQLIGECQKCHRTCSCLDPETELCPRCLAPLPPKPERESKCYTAFFVTLVIALLGFTGIVFAFIFSHRHQYAGKVHPIERMSEKQAEWIELNIYAAALNVQQTNWNVIVVPRTNSL